MRDALQRIWLERKISLAIMAVVLVFAAAVQALHAWVARPSAAPLPDEVFSEPL
jgi:hypothetical protein